MEGIAELEPGPLAVLQGANQVVFVEQMQGMFDAVVISGEVGMRKPEHRIYLHTAEALDLEPAACVFVDDLRPNVEAAVELGFVGIHHHDYDATAIERWP